MSSSGQDYAQVQKELDVAAGAMGIKLQYMNIQVTADFDRAFRDAARARAEAALLRVSGPILGPQRKHVVELAVKNRLPAMYESAEEVQAGGLVSYGVSNTDLYRRAAIYVDKILKGRTPADLPVEQPMKFESS